LERHWVKNARNETKKGVDGKNRTVLAALSWKKPGRAFPPGKGDVGIKSVVFHLPDCLNGGFKEIRSGGGRGVEKNPVPKNSV